MKSKRIAISQDKISQTILFIRGYRVMLDADLARLYGVSTKRLNEQVKRNLDRFPPEFMFKLIKSEKDEVVADCDHLGHLRFGGVKWVSGRLSLSM